MASSDIIKIGFDYRASLAQFEKETNGVFDGISEKAGKQKIVIQLDAKNDKVIEKIKELQKLKLDKFTFEFGDSGIKEQLKNFGQLENKINEIINLSKGIDGKVVGNGIGNSIVDEKSLNNIITLFTKMESHLGDMKKIFADVGDGEEFSPLLKMINNVQTSISELSTSIKGIGLNMNIDVGSDSEMEAKVQSKISNALQAYQRLFEHIKTSSAGGQIITDKFFDFDINQYDTMMGKLQAYKKFIDNMRKEAKTQFNGQDVLYQDTDKSYWTQASAAMGQVTKAFNEMNAASDTNPLKDLFGSGDLSEVVSQLGLIVAKLEEISITASSFKEIFSNGFNVTASVEEIDKLTNRVKELEDELSKIKLNPVSVDKSNISSENSIRSVLPSDSEFKNVIANLDLTKSKLGEIVKITRQAHADKDGKFYESFTLTDRNGSTETYGESSKTSKGQLLNYKYVEQNAKAAEQEAKAVKEVWDKNVKAIQDYMDAVTKLNNLKAQDKGTGTKSSQIALQEKNIEELKEKALDARKAISSMVNPHDVPIDTWRDWLEVMKKFDQASLGSAESVAKLEDALRNASESNLKSMKTSLQNYEGKLSDLSVKPDDAHRFPEYQAQLDSLNKAIQEYRTFVDSLQGKGIIDESDITESDKLKANIEELLKETKNFSSGDRGYTELGADKVLEKINSILEQNSAMSKKAKAQIKAYYNEILSGNPSRPLNEILDSVYKIVQAEREAGRAGQSWLEIFNTKKLYSFLGQAASMFSFYDLVNLGRNAFNAIRELDTALVDLKKTTTMSASELEQFYYDSNDVAKQMGVTTASIIEQASAWSRLGYSSKEAATQMAELSSQFASISPGMSTDDAQEGLVSIMKAWDISTDQVEREVMDNINILGNKFAETNQDIVEGMKRSAATFAALGQTWTDAFALFTGAQEVIQNAETVGKNISAYLYSNVMKIKVAISVKIQRWIRPRKDLLYVI